MAARGWHLGVADTPRMRSTTSRDRIIGWFVRKCSAAHWLWPVLFRIVSVVLRDILADPVLPLDNAEVALDVDEFLKMRGFCLAVVTA
jgi:hypothetical protein